ncbi:breast cancer type 2 susceptibility protein [Leptodactylus fuscus]|uniref:breast cancer type 2 susceptibility protein n=1 Tax=Leptodactylus fuscus TaxID=238119 RepID=UPI003F4ECC21
MASVQPAASVFFQLLQAHCSHADLGQINLNWFEELTREAVRLHPRLNEDEEKREGQPEDNVFKTPQQKRCPYSQLESTPTIFRDQRLYSPLFLSPANDQDKSQGTAENFTNSNKTDQSPDKTLPATDVFGTSNRSLADSPVLVKQLFKTPYGDGKYLHRTPRQDRRFEISDSLLCTPQLIRNQSSSRCISESLGVEADSEMSWSSSMATPPSPTVIIARDKEEPSNPRTFDREDVVIVRSLFSKMNSSAAGSLAPPPPKIDGDSTEVADAITSENTEKSPNYLKAQKKKTVLNAVGDEEACQVVENAIEGMEDVLSMFFTNDKPPELRKVKVDRIKRKTKPCSAMNDLLVENTEQQKTLYDSEEQNVNGRLLQEKTCPREISLSYEWTPLNLPDMSEENLSMETGGCGDGKMMENSAFNHSQLYGDEKASKGLKVTNKTTSRYTDHEGKPEEGFPHDAADDSKSLVRLVSGGHSSSFAMDCHIADQKPKPLLSTLKKQTKFLYNLKTELQQTETTAKTVRTPYNEPPSSTETPDVKSRRSLDSKNAASAHNLLEVEEEDDDFKDNSIDVQEIEETFMNMIDTDPQASPGVKSNLNETNVPSVEQHSEITYSNTKVKGSQTDGENKESNSQENPFLTGNDCDSSCNTSHLSKAESISVNTACIDLPVGTNMPNLGGFKMASNKKIHISEENLRKAKLLLKDDSLPLLHPIITGNVEQTPFLFSSKTDHVGFQTASRKEILVKETAIAKGSILFQDIEQEIYPNPCKRQKTSTFDQVASNVNLQQGEMTCNIEPNTSRNLDGGLPKEVKEENKMSTTLSACKQPSSDGKVKGDVSPQSLKENSELTLTPTPKNTGKRNLEGLLTGIQCNVYDVFTESQKAEINELSSILENAGSQFDFTQVKKLNLLGLDNENVQNPKSVSDSQKLNMSDVWKDVDFNDSFATGEGNKESSESESKTDSGTDQKSVPGSGIKPREGTVGGFTVTSSKSGNITDEDLIKAIDMFSDMEENVKEGNTKTAQDLQCLSKSKTFNVLSIKVDGKIPSNVVQITSIPSHVKTNERYSPDRLSSKQEEKCKSQSVQTCDAASSRCENPVSATCLSMPLGFSTGKGKLINIDKASIDKARTMFSDLMDTSDPHIVPGPSGLLSETNAIRDKTIFLEKKTHGLTPDPKPMDLSKEILDGPPQKPKQMCMTQKLVTGESSLQPHNKPVSKMSLFSTASGKPVLLSEEGLERAHKMFSEVDDGPGSDEQTSGTVLKESIVNFGGLPDASVHVKDSTFKVPQPGFSMANGKKIGVSEKCIQKAQEIFADIGELNVLDNLSIQNKSKGCDLGKNKVCVVLDHQNHRMNSSVTQDRKAKPWVGQNKESLGADVLTDKEEEMSIKTREDKIPDLSRTSFSTAGGKAIQLSEDSLKKAQRMFDDIDDGLLPDQGESSSLVKQNDRRNPKSTLPPLGFSTASGKTVAVSQTSLQKARQIFAETDPAVSEVGRTVKSNKTPAKNLDNFKANQRLPSSAAEAKDLKPTLNQSTDPKGEDTSICVPHRDVSNVKMAFFSTASGNPVQLSRKALQKARDMFADLDDDHGKDQSHTSVPVGSIKKGNKGMNDFSSQNLDNLQRLTEVNAPVVALPPVAFSTASGKTVTVSYEALQKAKRLFVDTEDLLDTAKSSQVNTRNQSEKHEGFPAVGQINQRRSSATRNETGEPVVGDGSVPKVPCFSTAGGKSMTVSEESLQRARELFSTVDYGCSSENGDIQPNPKSSSAVKVSVREKIKMPEPSEIKYSSNVPAKNSCAFSTASGKQVQVSEDALQKVKGLFDEINSDENFEDNLKERQQSGRMNTPKPLLSTKCDHSKTNTVEGNGGNQNTSARSLDFPRGVPLPRIIKHSTPLYAAGATNFCLTTSDTPENDFEIEAAESAKAFMDDEDLTDAELGTSGLSPASGKLPNIRNGKRLRSDDAIRGEPPIKRQLLPEFDRSLENESKAALKPLTSSPHESLKDRRKHFYKVPLQPLSSDPASFLKGKEDCLESRQSAPKHLHSTANVSHSALPTGSKPIPADCRNDPKNRTRSGTSSFLIPFKKTIQVSSGDQMVNSPRCEQDNTDNILSKSRVDGTSQKDGSGTDFSDLVQNIFCARDMQEMRIRKKQRQKIKPQPGTLYRQKTSSNDKISLLTAVEGRPPTAHTPAELYRCGVIKNHIGINSERARHFEFHCLDYYTRDCFLSEGGVQIGDGGWLVPTDKLTAGREEIYRSLCDTPGVDPKLISPEWMYNHYRWIVWKLAAMEVMFPKIFANRCLTPDRVLLQLKYRYDVEIDKCQRSAVRKIMERDDTAAKTLVLCISKILTLGSSEASDTKQTCAVLEVTDGWYGIKALLDQALTSLLKKERLFIGQKIIVHGAELVGSDEACTPLEAPESLMLKIAGNSTRPARWYARLGYFHDPRPFCLRLSSLLAEGGIVGCVDVLIQRIYPMQWMEKMGNGTYVFRNERAEEREAERHSAKKQKSLEVLYVRIQEEYEKQQVCAGKKRSRRQSLSEPQIRALQDGAELYEALQNESDPSYLESCLSSDQLRALNHHRQLLHDQRHAQIQAEFRKAIESSEQEAGSSTRRDVTPVWKIRIVDYREQDSTAGYMLNIWRPLPDVVSLLKEGGRFKIYQLAASQSKAKSETAAVQLTATKKTQFQQLQPLQDVLEQIYTERQVTELGQFLEPHFTAAYGEVDVVGLVISSQQKPGAAPLVYLSDEMCNIVALKLYTDLGQLALEELTRPGVFIAAVNLRWRSEYMAGVPVVFAGDLSFIAANPKEHHVQRAIQKLRQSIQSVPEFCKEMENKLMTILQTPTLQERASLSRCGAEPRSHLAAGNKCSTPVPKINNPQMKHLSTPDGNNAVLSTSIDTDPKTCKKMKGLDYLRRIPSPAPLTPMRTSLTPSLQRAFRPPRSLQKEDCARAKASLNSDSCTSTKLEGGFVADEELAMINTQALVSGLGGGRPITEEETTAIPNISHPVSEDTPKTEEVSQAPHQRRLCRKRKQKP